MNKLKYILSFIQKILVLAKEIFFSETSDRQKIKKQIKEINREIEKYIGAMDKAARAGHHQQLNYFSDKLQVLKARRDELQRILNS